MRLCPNCGQEVAESKAFCQNCGADMNTAWPPPPEDGTKEAGTAEPETRLLTGNAKGDFALGLFCSFILLFVAGLGLLVLPIIYLVLRNKFKPYVMFARGIGWGALVGWGVTLGAIAVCTYMISQNIRQGTPL
jgi:hypothetical protein